MLPETGTVLACVSGGADSMCMLEVLLDISLSRGFELCAAHFNHGLRGEESVRDEEFVRKQLAARRTLLFTGGGDARAYAKENGMSVEMAAREMRYGFFRETAAAAGAARIATAHTADDNAETVILNLVRGAGAAGLSGIPPRRGAIVRPMLRVSRDEVMRYIGLRGISYVDDSTNELEIYTRNRIRRAVIPVLRDINPGFGEAVASASEILRADEEYLSGLADRFISERCAKRSALRCTKRCMARTVSGVAAGAAPTETESEAESEAESERDLNHNYDIVTADAGELLALPFSVSSRVVRRICRRSLSLKHVKSALDLCAGGDPSAGVSLPGMTVYREYERVVFDQTAARGGSDVHGRPGVRGADDNGSTADGSTADSSTTDGSSAAGWRGIREIALADGVDAVIPETGLMVSCIAVTYENAPTMVENAPARRENAPAVSENAIINKSFNIFLFKSSDLCGKMTVRSRREGDKIRLSGGNGTKTLKKLFIERRIPARERAYVPVVADDAGVLAVCGLGIGDRAVPQKGDPALRVEFSHLKGLK